MYFMLTTRVASTVNAIPYLVKILLVYIQFPVSLYSSICNVGSPCSFLFLSFFGAEYFISFIAHSSIIKSTSPIAILPSSPFPYST